MSNLNAIEFAHKTAMKSYLIALNSGDAQTQDAMRNELTRLFHMRMAILIRMAQS